MIVISVPGFHNGLGTVGGVVLGDLQYHPIGHPILVTAVRVVPVLLIVHGIILTPVSPDLFSVRVYKISLFFSGHNLSTVKEVGKALRDFLV